MLLWRGFADVIKVSNQLKLDKVIILGGPDLIRWALKRAWAFPDKRDLKCERDLIWVIFSIAGFEGEGSHMERMQSASMS